MKIRFPQIKPKSWLNSVYRTIIVVQIMDVTNPLGYEAQLKLAKLSLRGEPGNTGGLIEIQFNSTT